MSLHNLTIEAYDRPAAIERVLRVIRHRGFHMCRMAAESSLESGKMTLDITVQSERSVLLLTTQLNKLVDVTTAKITSANTEKNQLRISA